MILTLVTAVTTFPVITIIAPMFNIWSQIGLYDTWPGLIIPYLSLTLPISIWTLSAFFREIPWEMEQAAQVDGATTWQAFRKVIVPLAAPGVFTTAIIAFFIAWNDFVYGISLTSTEAAGMMRTRVPISGVSLSSSTAMPVTARMGGRLYAIVSALIAPSTASSAARARRRVSAWDATYSAA